MSKPPIDRPAVELLVAAECRALLGASGMGRAVFSVDCLPEAVPVAVAVTDARVVLASPLDALWLAGSRHDVLSVQVDGRDNGMSWNVQVTGIASLLDDDGAGLDPAWFEEARGRRDHLVWIPFTHLRGHRVAWLAGAAAEVIPKS